MKKTIKDFFKKLFCKHNYERISWWTDYDSNQNVVCSMRTYECTRCGKKISVDGRRDPYCNTNVIKHFM